MRGTIGLTADLAAYRGKVPSRARLQIGRQSMTVARPTLFWFTISAIAVMALLLLRPILLPFAVGATLAYLLVPAVDSLERHGINRSLAALILVLLLVVGLVGLVLLMLPAIIGEL